MNHTSNMDCECIHWAGRIDFGRVISHHDHCRADGLNDYVAYRVTGTKGPIAVSTKADFDDIVSDESTECEYESVLVRMTKEDFDSIGEFEGF